MINICHITFFFYFSLISSCLSLYSIPRNPYCMSFCFSTWYLWVILPSFILFVHVILYSHLFNVCPSTISTMSRISSRVLLLLGYVYRKTCDAAHVRAVSSVTTLTCVSYHHSFWGAVGLKPVSQPGESVYGKSIGKLGWRAHIDWDNLLLLPVSRRCVVRIHPCRTSIPIYYREL